MISTPVKDDSKGQVVYQLIENNANINAVDLNMHSPLHLACCSGEFEIVTLLLDYY